VTEPVEGLADLPESWEVIDSRIIHQDDWILTFREDKVLRPGHPDEQLPRLVLDHPGAVAILAVDAQERVRCLRQYRHSSGMRFVELPAGLRDAGEDEDPLETAKRELREEAELRAGDWRHLFTTWPTPGFTNEKHWFYLARDLSHWDRGDFQMHGEEAELEHFWVPMEDLIDGIFAGRISDGPVVQAVLAYDALKRRGQL
jgi:8-oxo-dGTP pyrophosphatase MutT (NUDIX family)